MKIVQIAPTLITILSLASAIVYYWQGDWKHGLYWTGAFIIGVAVTL